MREGAITTAPEWHENGFEVSLVAHREFAL